MKNAFLQGELKETIHIAQPPGYQTNPDLVCRLHKAIYRLKQVPKSWYTRLSGFLILNDFNNNMTDTSQFVYKKDRIIIWLIIYVDDLIITGNNELEVENFINHLCQEFKCRDLRIPKSFLGMEVIHNFDGSLDKNQSRYAFDILAKYNMLNKSTKTRSDLLNKSSAYICT